MTDEPMYALKDSKGEDYVPLSSIVRIEGAGNYVLVYMDGQHEANKQSGNLAVHEKRLQGDQHFVRIHNSHIINVNFVARLEKNGTVILMDGEEVRFTIDIAILQAAIDAR